MRRRRSPLVALLALGVCVLAAWIFVAPGLTYRRIQDAAARGDVEALSEMVDFPALRASVKQNVQNTVARGISGDDPGVVAAATGMVVGRLAGPLVDAAVTPAGIAALTRGQRPSRDPKAKRKDEPRMDVDRGWESPRRWAARYRDPESGDETIAVILRRDGMRWRLTGVRFGPDVR